MESIELDVRYYHQPWKAYVDESDFGHKSLHWKLPVDQIALILVDVWSDLYVRSHLDRGREITLARILPVLETFRRIGATVVHAPSPDCAKRYGAWTRYAGDTEVHGAKPTERDDWPPPEFRSKSGAYEAWSRPKQPKDKRFDDIIANRSIIPEVEPQEGDHVILNGDQMHRLLKHREVLWLFYVGFAANMCVPFRDYGTRAMKNRGYDIILVRDCTSAIEVADTVDGLELSNACVVDTELTIGYTVSSSELLEACEAEERGEP